MIGIILWALLILFICICVNGWEFIGMLLLCCVVYLAVLALFFWAKSKISK